MISIKHLGIESQLSSQYPDIEEFYQTQLKLHRISVTDRLFLSVLEMPSKAEREKEQVRIANETTEINKANSSTMSESGLNETITQDHIVSSKDKVAKDKSTTIDANTDDDYSVLGAEAVTATTAFQGLSQEQARAELSRAESLENSYNKDVEKLTGQASASSYEQDIFSNADIKSFWACNGETADDTDTLVIVPGRAENEHKYAELLYNLQDSNLRVVVCFVRGQGQSSNVIYGSTKCHVEYFANYRHDLETMLNYLNIGSNYKMLGFSLGGLISLDFCFFGTYPHKPKALGLISPFLGINYPFSPVPLYYLLKGLCFIRSFALAYTPHGKEYKRIPFEENYHSHSMVRYNIYHDYYADHPQQAIAGPSFNFVKCCLRAHLKLRSDKVKFTFPVICLSSELDKVVNTQDAQNFFAQHQNDPVPPRFEIIKGAFHDILNETDKFRNPTLAKALDFLFPGTVNLIDPKEELAAQEAAEQAEQERRMAIPLDSFSDDYSEDEGELSPSKQ